MIPTQGIEMMELSATSRSLTLGRSVIPLQHVYTPYLAARAVGWLKVWLLGYRVLLATKHCNLLPSTWWCYCKFQNVLENRFRFVPHLLQQPHSSQRWVQDWGSYFDFVVDFQASDFPTFLRRTRLKLAAWTKAELNWNSTQKESWVNRNKAQLVKNKLRGYEETRSPCFNVLIVCFFSFCKQINPKTPTIPPMAAIRLEMCAAFSTAASSKWTQESVQQTARVSSK